jgi:aminoglycoside/choline kinase family phosphotransferase
MQQAGLNVPRILAWDATHGFMLLSDLGHTP